MKLGIDIGSTNIKIVLMDNEKIVKKLFFYMEGKKFINLLDRAINFDIMGEGSIYITGVGSSYIKNNKKLSSLVDNKKIVLVSEIEALSKGALTLTKLSNALVASCGTGTAFIKASIGGAVHLGGSGVGGGTIVGLSSLLGISDDIEKIKLYALDGNTNNLDSLIEDITLKSTKLLAPNVTAANFGKAKINKKYNKFDISSSILNMVYQTIAMLSVFAARSIKENNVILVGALSESKYAKKVLKDVEALHEDINFFIPDDGIYACCMGATIL